MLIFTCKTKPSQGSILESFWTGQHHILYHAPALMGEHYMVQSFIEQLSMARRGQPLCRNVKDKLQCNSWPPSYAEWLTEQAYFSVQMSPMLLTFYRATDLHFHQGCRLILFSAKLLAWDWQDRICLRDSHILIVQDKKKWNPIELRDLTVVSHRKMLLWKQSQFSERYKRPCSRISFWSAQA